MPTIEISHRGLCRLVGKNLTVDRLKDEGMLYAKGEIDEVKGDTLKVETKSSIEATDHGEAVLSEFVRADFYREFLLSRELDRENIAASWNNGVLTLRVPKGGSKTHKIAIESS